MTATAILLAYVAMLFGTVAELVAIYLGTCIGLGIAYIIRCLLDKKYALYICENK